MHNTFTTAARTTPHRHNGPQRHHYRPSAQVKPTATPRSKPMQQRGCQRQPGVYFLIFVTAILLALASGAL